MFHNIGSRALNGVMLIAEQKKRLEESTKVKGISFDSKLDRFIAKAILCAKFKIRLFYWSLTECPEDREKIAQYL